MKLLFMNYKAERNMTKRSMKNNLSTAARVKNELPSYSFYKDYYKIVV